MDNTSGVGVLDKAALVLTALESGPATLAGLVTATGLARPTAHRLAVALEHHRLVARDLQGRFVLGPRLAELSVAAGEDRLLATAGPVLARLRDITGESSQLWRRQGDYRVCVAAAERPSGLRDTIPVGSQLTMRAGSAAQVLLAWEDPERIHRGLQNAAYSAAALSGIRRRGWAQSVGEREQGVASVSAPVRSPSGKIVAAVSVSGPLERLSRQPGRMHAPAVVAAAERLAESLRRAAAE
jgi:DNA-binding IclR family transcriptional regulator